MVSRTSANEYEDDGRVCALLSSTTSREEEEGGVVDIAAMVVVVVVLVSRVAARARESQNTHNGLV